MNPNPRGVWVDPKLHAALIEYAWLKRTTMSDVLRAVLDFIIDNPHDEGYLQAEDLPGRKRIAAKTTDEQWDRAAQVAHDKGIPFFSLVRRNIINVLDKEGLLP